MMVPDCHKRLETALADLKATLVSYKNFLTAFKFFTSSSSVNATIVLLQAELKESNEQGAEIGEAESTITEVEAVVKPTED